jgi:Arc/MetJ family transcription regulator
MYQYTYFIHMKITLNVDDKLMKEALAVAGTDNKTMAIDLALRDFVKRGSLLSAIENLGSISPEDWKAALDPNYDVLAIRTAETGTMYGRKPRPRR